MLSKFILAFILVGSLNSFSHEGHNDAPGQIKANHGGKVEVGKEINLEFVVSGNEVKLFPASHEGKDLTADEITISATTKLPKGKPEPIKLNPKEGGYVAIVDFKTAYRVEMSIEAVLKSTNKKSNFKIQIEK